MLLLKEYARAGYEAAHGQTNPGFEAMWGQAFGLDSDEGSERREKTALRFSRLLTTHR